MMWLFVSYIPLGRRFFFVEIDMWILIWVVCLLLHCLRCLCDLKFFGCEAILVE